MGNSFEWTAFETLQDGSGRLQIGDFEPFGEPTIYRSEQVYGLPTFATVSP
jgi:hypothetical protein